MTTTHPARQTRAAGPSRRVTMRPRRLPLSTQVSLRTLLIGLLVAGLTVAVGIWTMTLGEFPLSFGAVARTVFGIGEVPSGYDFIVNTLRLPRTLAAILVGAALGASGAIFQGLVRNPLVAPDIIGVNAGAAVIAVYLIVVTQSAALVPVGTFAGALITAFAIYLLTWRKGISGNRLVLVGIGVNAMLVAVTTLLTIRFPVEQVAPAVLWQIGTIYGAEWSDVAVLLAGLGLVLPVALWLTRHLRVLQLGDETARGLGVRAEPTRAALIVAGAGLAAVAVAAAGPVGFVALIAPHIARMLAGPLTGGVLVLAALIGALLLAVSDLVAQHALPISLPAGAVTALIGAPYFLYLIYRSNRVL